ncbi:TPA: hypothetical protein LA827_003326 [Clostridium botulinum]|nr:hypothetical protein [Clostridium botulinum]
MEKKKSDKKDIGEFMELALQLKEKNRDAYIETRGFLRGLVQKEQFCVTNK